MQRPRRTFEFHDEPGTATKRQSRLPQRLGAPSPMPSTSKKCFPRQSRLTVPTRDTSCDSVKTPQKTPLQNKRQVTRALFTTGVAHYNDKKWIQEQTQRITDFLRELNCRNEIPGIDQQFFARPGILRQMTIKQLVAIINYFLTFISGNRLLVGSNHVDDIVNILQKLQYPHQVNKSWLKTPNAQHSFGNVIMILDFLMDLVPSNDEDEMSFPLQDPQEATSTVTQMEFAIPDVEFHAEMLRNCEEAFMLWDKQLDSEFNNLQKKTIDLLIQKRCNVPGYEAALADMEHMRGKLAELEKQRPIISKEEEQLNDRLEEELNGIMKEIAVIREDIHETARAMKKQKTLNEAANKTIAGLEAEIANQRAILSNQRASVGQRDKLREEVAQMKHMLQSQERTISALQERYHHQQVLISRAKKDMVNQIEKFNVLMHEITYSEISLPSEKLQLPMNASLKDIQSRISLLLQVEQQTKQKLQQNTHQIDHYHRLMADIKHEIEATLIPKEDFLAAAIDAGQKALLEKDRQWTEQRLLSEVNIQQLDKLSLQMDDKVQSLREVIAIEEKEIAELSEANERIMSEAEALHAASIREREAELDEYEESLKVVKEGIDRLTELVQANDKQLESHTNRD